MPTNVLNNLPDLLGNRTHVPDDEVRSITPHSREHIEVSGSSFYGSITLPDNHVQHRAFSLNLGDRLVRPVFIEVNSTGPIEINIISGEMIHSSHFLPGNGYSIRFSMDFWIREYTDFYIDLTNRESQEVTVSCMIALHCLARQGMLMRADEWSIAHIETPEQRTAREVREREAIQRRIGGEERSWTELNAMIGRRATEALKNNKPILFTGSNGDSYSIKGNGELSNVSKGRSYCVVLNSTESLPVADIIMEKMKWVMHDAEEVERVKNDIGELNLLEERSSLITV